MVTVAVFRIVRQSFKLCRGSAKLAHFDMAQHPHVHRCYFHAAIVIYLAHIAVSLKDGIQLEAGITALATLVELISHLSEEA